MKSLCKIGTEPLVNVAYNANCGLGGNSGSPGPNMSVDYSLRRRQLLLFPSILLLLCLSVSSHATDINAASCSSADVQNAINAASNGDRVLVPAGTCTWTTAVSIPNTKGIV